jgi:hypothetical protein
VTALAAIAHHVDAQLRPEPGRVIARLFLPGEELPGGRSRSGAVIARVLALSDAEVDELAAGLIADFAGRHREYPAMLAEHASMVRSHLRKTPKLSGNRAMVLGASFTAEYAVEGAALCNPSAVLHPDQSGLDAGAARVAVSLRAIGEGHISSVGFATAIIGPGASWTFDPRVHPIVAGTTSPARWGKEHFRAVLLEERRLDGLAHNVLADLPATFTGLELEQVLAEAHHDLLSRSGGAATVDLLRRSVSSAYEVAFPADIALSQQVLFPAVPDERNGIEDVRLVRFTGDDGIAAYRATYTAFDGTKIAPRLLTSADLQSFE